MASSTIGETLGTLRASRERADLLLERAAADARRLEHEGAERARAEAAARLREVEQLRRTIASHADRIEHEAARMAETMAVVTTKLTELAREADFSPPPWPAPTEPVVAPSDGGRAG